MKKIIIGSLLLLIAGIIAYPYYLLNDFKEKLKSDSVETAELLDKDKLHKSVKSSLRKVLKKLVAKYPTEGGTGVSIEQWGGLKKTADKLIEHKNFSLLLSGTRPEDLPDDRGKQGNIEQSGAQDSSYWAYFSSFNRYKVSADHISFDFEYIDGEWLLVGMEFELDWEDMVDKARLARRERQSFDPRLVEPQYISPHFSVEDMKQTDTILSFMNDGFFAASRVINNEVQVQTNFSHIPFEIDYKADWRSVVMKDGSDGIQRPQENRKSDPFRGMSGTDFNSYASNVRVKPEVEYSDINYIEGEVTYRVPTNWEVFEFELPGIGFSKTKEDISIYLAQLGQNKMELGFSIPSAVPHGGKMKVEVFDKEGRQLKVESRGRQAQTDKKGRSGTMDLEYHGPAHTAKVYVVTKFKEYKDTVRAHAGLGYKTVQEQGLTLEDLEEKIMVSRYMEVGSIEFQKTKEISDVDELIKQIGVASIETSTEDGLKIILRVPEYPNAALVKFETSDLKAFDSNNTELSVNYSKLAYPYLNKLLIKGTVEGGSDIQRLSGEIKIKYPLAVETTTYSNGDNIEGVEWFPNGISVAEEELESWGFIRAFDDRGLELRWLLQAPAEDNPKVIELGFWGQVKTISVESIVSWHTLTFDLSNIGISRSQPEQAVES